MRAVFHAELHRCIAPDSVLLDFHEGLAVLVMQSAKRHQQGVFSLRQHKKHLSGHCVSQSAVVVFYIDQRLVEHHIVENGGRG